MVCISLPLQIMLILAICGSYVAHPKSTLMCRLLKYPQIIWYLKFYITQYTDIHIYKSFNQNLKLEKAATANAARKSSHSFALYSLAENALGIISGLCYMNISVMDISSTLILMIIINYNLQGIYITRTVMNKKCIMVNAYEKNGKYHLCWFHYFAGWEMCVLCVFAFFS